MMMDIWTIWVFNAPIFVFVFEFLSMQVEWSGRYLGVMLVEATFAPLYIRMGKKTQQLSKRSIRAIFIWNMANTKMCISLCNKTPGSGFSRATLGEGLHECSSLPRLPDLSEASTPRVTIQTVHQQECTTGGRGSPLSVDKGGRYWQHPSWRSSKVWLSNVTSLPCLISQHWLIAVTVKWSSLHPGLVREMPTLTLQW